MRPQLWVLAGPNGAGKSTLVNQYARGRLPIVNPDDIALTLPSDIGQIARILQAGRLAVAARADMLRSRQSFAIETTLTGNSELALIREAAGSDYKVTLVYVGLHSVRLSVVRVEQRVLRGGHDVPLVDLERRFERSTKQLKEAAKLVDRLILIDNSGERRRLVYSEEGGRRKFVATKLPRWARDATGLIAGA